MDNLKERMWQMRKEFHKIAEPGWLEFETTKTIIDYLESYGYNLKFGKEIHSERMGLPDGDEIKKHRNKVSVSFDEEEFEILEGYTGVVASLDTGKEGPTIGIRFDIDANEIQETKDEDHRPNKEGFRSKNDFAMHACGHDGHITIGLFLAEWIMKNKNNLKGKFILIFQPAEEGVRGAKSMVGAGVVDELDYLLAGHIGLGVGSGILGLGTIGFLATSKLDIHFEGIPSHAGANPELGKNALLAAANCAINLHTLPQFSTGMSRLNVGVLQAGSSRNIVPNKSMLRVETRGDKEEINQMLKEKARYVVEGSAKTFDVDYEIIEVGGAPAYNTYDKELVDLVSGYLENDFNIDIARSLGGSEDVTYMMNKVEENGGKSLHFMFGSDLAAAHHNNKFDFDKNTLPMAFGALSKTIKLLAK
ncbi:MAG TPA: amidohydrolase [Tissierellaceae bacterium]|nr:amidohydrolase [Tissierellaceae bacterium]